MTLVRGNQSSPEGWYQVKFLQCRFSPSLPTFNLAVCIVPTPVTIRSKIRNIKNPLSLLSCGFHLAQSQSPQMSHSFGEKSSQNTSCSHCVVLPRDCLPALMFCSAPSKKSILFKRIQLWKASRVSSSFVSHCSDSVLTMCSAVSRQRSSGI